MERPVKVFADWFYTTQDGENYSLYEVGHNGITLISYHEPKGEGDRHYCDVYFNTGKSVRVFNISSIEFIEE